MKTTLISLLITISLTTCAQPKSKRTSELGQGLVAYCDSLSKTDPLPNNKVQRIMNAEHQAILPYSEYDEHYERVQLSDTVKYIILIKRVPYFFYEKEYNTQKKWSDKK